MKSFKSCCKHFKRLSKGNNSWIFDFVKHCNVNLVNSIKLIVLRYNTDVLTEIALSLQERERANVL